MTVYIDHSPQPTAGKRPCARVPTGHCLWTNGTSEPQAELHSVHSFLYFPIGTNVIVGLKYCVRPINIGNAMYKQGAESLLVADWSKSGHLNIRLGEPAASAGSFPPHDGFTVEC